MRQFDLTTIDVAATRPFHADDAGAQHDLTSPRAMPVADPFRTELGVLVTNDPSELGGDCCIATGPAAVEITSSPSLIAAATSAIATVASNGKPASSASACGVVMFTTGTFFIGDPLSPVQVSWWTPEPC